MMMLEYLTHSTTRWRAGEIGDASYAALYFLHWQVHSHGKRFASRKFKHDPRPDPSAWFEETANLPADAVRDYLVAYFERYQFLGIIHNVPVALVAWLKREWNLALCEHIPDPLAVLRMQVEGKRPVTVLSAWPRMLEPVLSKPNAFAFMIHDLEHAWKFFHDPEMHHRQRDFFRFMLEAVEAMTFADYLEDPVFAAKFDYVVSDMNTHIMHSSQFLRAILVEFHLRREGVPHHDALSQVARYEVSRLMSSLLGADWLAEVERRMIPGHALAETV